jgi:CRP-like cAMP-binding protein
VHPLPRYHPQAVFGMSSLSLERVESLLDANSYFHLFPLGVRRALAAEFTLIELHAGANGNYSYRDGCIYFPINCVLVAEYPSSDSTAIFMRFFGARFFVGVRARTVLATIDFEVRLIRGGHALKINLDRFWSIVTDCTQFLQLTAQTTSAFAELVLLNHACLATHDATQRLMRLLLEARDAYPDDVGITLTQAQLGQFVGIRRETVTDILKQFAQRGWVTLERGSVSIADLDGARRASCLCSERLRQIDASLYDIARNLLRGQMQPRTPRGVRLSCSARS